MRTGVPLTGCYRSREATAIEASNLPKVRWRDVPASGAGPLRLTRRLYSTRATAGPCPRSDPRCPIPNLPASCRPRTPQATRASHLSLIDCRRGMAHLGRHSCKRGDLPPRVDQDGPRTPSGCHSNAGTSCDRLGASWATLAIPSFFLCKLVQESRQCDFARVFSRCLELVAAAAESHSHRTAATP